MAACGALLAACALLEGPVWQPTGSSPVGVQAKAAGQARFVGFVGRDGSRYEYHAATFAMVLPDGDWLASVDQNAVRLSADGREIRWVRRDVGLWQAVTRDARSVIAFGTLPNASAPNGVESCIYLLDTTTGAPLWKVSYDGATGLARVGSITVAASVSGETAVDDAGNARWTSKHPIVQGSAVATLGRAVVIVDSPQLPATDSGPLAKHLPLLVRTLDADTGAERSRLELPARGDAFWLRQMAIARDGRLAVYVDEVRVHARTEIVNQSPTTVVSQEAEEQLVVIDAAESAHPIGRAMAMPKALVASPVAKLSASEVAFLDTYATAEATLGLTIVDLATGRARRSSVMAPKHVDVGKGLSSFVQVLQTQASADRITFAGLFDGEVAPLHAPVREVDWCEARGHVECFGGEVLERKTTIAPFAGLIGTIEFAP